MRPKRIPEAVGWPEVTSQCPLLRSPKHPSKGPNDHPHNPHTIRGNSPLVVCLATLE